MSKKKTQKTQSAERRPKKIRLAEPQPKNQSAELQPEKNSASRTSAGKND